MTNRLPQPWTINNNEDAYWIEDAEGHRFAYTYFRDQPIVGTDRSPRLTRDLARRITLNVAKLPDLLKR
jgi:hypothetical protein